MAKDRQLVKANLSTIYDNGGHFWGWSRFKGKPHPVYKGGRKIKGVHTLDNGNGIGTIGNLVNLNKINFSK